MDPSEALERVARLLDERLPAKHANGNGSMWRNLLPLWIAAALQLGGGLWFLSGVNSALTYQSREIDQLKNDNRTLLTNIQTLRERLAEHGWKVPQSAPVQPAPRRPLLADVAQP